MNPLPLRDKLNLMLPLRYIVMDIFFHPEKMNLTNKTADTPALAHPHPPHFQETRPQVNH
jgi:hypothetical protein